MKKSIALCLMTLTLFVALSLFSACNKQEDDPAVTDTEAVTQAEVPSGIESDTTPESETLPEESDSQTETETEEAATNYFEATKIDIVEPDTSKVPDMAIADDGYDIYLLTKGDEWGYRYGCTYLYNADGSVDAYFACVGTISGEWDWISYRHSPDGGETWENEKVVLTPTQNSMDHFSTCDPGVVYFNGYYYLGYTSTLNGTGLCNNLFVARSKNPDGPFEKWNGAGWGGPEPQPIVYFDENWQSWGIGEPSFVELNGTLYIYYTCSAPSGSYCMVATADAKDENWPATMEFHGIACKKGNYDSLDVKYVEEWGKFIGVCTADRMGAASWLAVYESNDGLTFTLADGVREGTYSHLHNAGLSSRPNGHIRLSEDEAKLCVVYAYGDGWGIWNTRVQPVALTLSDGNDINAEKAKPNIPDPVNRADMLPVSERYVAMVRPTSDVYEYPVTKSSFIIQLKLYDTYFKASAASRNDELIRFTDYDESVITISGTKVTVEGVGETSVTVHYGDLEYVFWVRITETDEKGSSTKAVSFEPVRETYTIAYQERSLFCPQIRGQIKWADGTFTELYVQDSDETVVFDGYDDSVISVSPTGIITAKAVGETDVIVTCRGMSFVVHVVVTADETQGYYNKKTVELLDDYTSLDFSKSKTLEAISSTNNCTVETTGEAVRLTVTDMSPIDPIVTIGYNQSPDVMSTADYNYMEITYMVPVTVSAKATRLQVFVCAGDVTEPNASYQVMQNLTVDGAYHTLRIRLSDLSCWTGDIHALRVDFFDQAEPGDVMYIQTIKLTK